MNLFKCIKCVHMELECKHTQKESFRLNRCSDLNIKVTNAGICNGMYMTINIMWMLISSSSLSLN